VNALLEGKKRLIVVPHGALSSLPFEALVGGDGRFLIEHFEVSYTLSATLAAALQTAHGKRAERSRKSFVGMADPVYDWQAFAKGGAEGRPAATRGLELWSDADAEDAARPRGLTRLPGTAKELRRIGKLFGGDKRLYFRAEASEDVVKSGGLGGYRIVHIASHGLMTPMYQALALTLKPKGEDGFLLASEIAELELDADLVVLSACRTGNVRRRAGGEPVGGLALSLRSAGAERVVLSLWSVADEATAELMERFYRPLVRDGAHYGTALAAAKREMIAGAHAHPYFWAAFVLHGR
jgi:CHAT domain-containing protein